MRTPTQRTQDWHLLGEVEVVFGFWAMVLLFLVVHSAPGTRSIT